MSGARVIAGTRITSRTLNTLMPNVSLRPVRLSVPRVNSRISSLLVPASLVRASIFFKSSDMLLLSVKSPDPEPQSVAGGQDIFQYHTSIWLSCIL